MFAVAAGLLVGTPLPHQDDLPCPKCVRILAEIATGTLRVAVNGEEIRRYTDNDPSRLSKGPIGMQRHGGGGSEYRDIFVEADPTEQRLYTVK